MCVCPVRTNPGGVGAGQPLAAGLRVHVVARAGPAASRAGNAAADTRSAWFVNCYIFVRTLSVATCLRRDCDVTATSPFKLSTSAVQTIIILAM